MRKFIFFAISILICQGAVYEDIGNANEHFDNALAQLLQEPSIRSEIEPVDIPDIKQDKFEASKGKLWGLSSVKRDGNCTYGISDHDIYGNKQDTFIVSASVASNNIKFTMNYKFRVLFVTVDGEMEGELGEIAASCRFFMNEKETAVLESLKVTRFENFKITRVSAFSLQSSWILKTVANSIAQNHKSDIVNSLENGVTTYLRSLLKEVRIE